MLAGIPIARLLILATGVVVVLIVAADFRPRRVAHLRLTSSLGGILNLQMAKWTYGCRMTTCKEQVDQ